MKIMNHQKEEDTAVQRYPLNSEILAKLPTMALSSPSIDSKKNLIFNVICLGCFIGPRVSEYAQTSSKKFDYHKYPLGKKVIKAFTANDFVFFDKSGHTLELRDNSCLDQANTVKIGQNITLSGKKTCHKICAVCAAGQMVLHARHLGQPNNMPVACYSYKGNLVYLKGKRIENLLHNVVKAIFPRTFKAKLKQYSAHLLQVWACVLLDEAGISPEFIMARLRWMGNSFRMYLRNTGIIQDKHCNILWLRLRRSST
jgi:hypothetical protein